MRWAVGNPALKNRPGDSKIKYLKSRLALSDEEVKQAFQKVVQIEQFMSQKKAAAAARQDRLAKIDAKFAMVAFYAKEGPEHSMVDYYKPQPEPTPPAAKPGTPAAGAKKPGTPAEGAARAATMTPREK